MKPVFVIVLYTFTMEAHLHIYNTRYYTNRSSIQYNTFKSQRNSIFWRTHYFYFVSSLLFVQNRHWNYITTKCSVGYDSCYIQHTGFGIYKIKIESYHFLMVHIHRKTCSEITSNVNEVGEKIAHASGTTSDKTYRKGKNNMNPGRKQKCSASAYMPYAKSLNSVNGKE